MTDENGFGWGLSEAEKDDLETLIQSVQEDDSVPPVESGEVPEESGRRDLDRRLGQLAAAVLDMDERVSALQEIVRLSRERSELLEWCLERAVWPREGGTGRRAPS